MTTDMQTNGTVEILIAEDSPTQAAQLARLLERHGYSVTTAANGREALALLACRKPTLVITDIVMPELDGYGLCKAIKADKRLKGIPVMLVTTLSDPQDVIRGLECGADNFLRKPYDERYLLSRVDYLLMNLELRKTQKMQMGMEIDLGGQKHFISAERQQILDLLISTYEQAVELNGELKQRGEELAHASKVLNALYRIAEGLNHAESEREVADTVLARAMELPGIQAGWISLRDGESGFRLAAARNLPPALAAPGAMEGDCTCRRRLISGELDSITNILECERLGRMDGDTRGLRYHASVPLWLGDRTLGVMNLVGPEQGLFNDDELHVLYGVGNQVAVALERAYLREHLERLVQERTAALEAEIEERKRVEKEQARLVAIIEATSDLVGTADLEGRPLFINRAGPQMLGFGSEREMLAERIEASHPEWAARLVRETAIPYAIEHGTWGGETALLHRDGHEIPVSQVIIAHKGTDGSVEYLSTIARDITLQKAHEARITRLNRVYAVLSGINTTIVRTRDRQELFDEACRIAVELGKFRLAWIGLLDANGVDVTPVSKAGVDDGYLDNIQLTARDGAPDRCEMLARALRENTPVVCNDIDTDPQMARWRDEARRRGYRSVVVFPLQLAGKVLGVLLFYASEKDFFDTEEMRLLTEIAGDISFALGHLEADEYRKSLETRLESVLQSVPDVLFSLSAGMPGMSGVSDLCGLSYVSPAVTGVAGFTPEEFMADAGLWLRRVMPDDMALVREALGRAQRGEGATAQFRITHRDGTTRWLDGTVVPVRNARGEVERLDGIARDVTVTRQLEFQLRQAQKMEMVGQLAGGVAHDFNNMLCVILGWAEMSLAEAAPGNPLREALEEIRKSGEAASSLTRQLLAFSRKQLVEPTIVNVTELVASADKMLRRLIGEHVEWASRTTADIGRVKIDRGQLEQVLMNLVLNARDAMPAGGKITIETSDVLVDARSAQGVPDVAPGEYVLLAVTDTGTGMSEEVRMKIFEPFFTTKEINKGTGLGLATCYGIARQAGGDIVVSSQEGIGTTMTVYLPRCDATATVRRTPTGVPVRGAGTILLVEDDPAVRLVTTRMLEAQGYRVVNANGGVEALRMIADDGEPIDLLLTDVVLAGGMNGVTLAERVRMLRPALRILFASGYTSDVSIVHGLLERGVALAHKPFTAELLGEKVREVLDAE